MSAMKEKSKSNTPTIHCIMCGKNFKVSDKAACGGSYNGAPLCSTNDIQRKLDSDGTSPHVDIEIEPGQPAAPAA